MKHYRKTQIHVHQSCFHCHGPFGCDAVESTVLLPVGVALAVYFVPMRKMTMVLQLPSFLSHLMPLQEDPQDAKASKDLL